LDPRAKLADVGYLLDYGVGICACWRKPRRARFTIPQARALLIRLKEASSARVTFMPDHHDVSQITDGHLSKLASANGAALATLNENMPGSHLIAK
jgi:hypothetical protein